VNVVRAICRQFSVALAHVHHLIGSGAELVHTLKDFRLPVVFSFHDFYTLCPTIQLIDDRGNFCGGQCTSGPGDCGLAGNLFHANAPRLKHQFVHEHRRRMVEALRRCDAFVAPSAATRQFMSDALPFLHDAQFHVIEHGRRMGPRPPLVNGDGNGSSNGNGHGDGVPREPVAAPRAGERVRVLCMGNLNRSKGTDLILRVMRLDAERGRRFEFHFLGLKEPGFDPDALGGVYHGAYERDRLPGLLRRIRPSLAMIASIWPETYCYTLTEAWALGLPVVASDLGAPAERLRKHGGGWLADPTDAGGWYQTMLDAIDTPGAYEEQARRAAAMTIRSVEDMTAAYAALYERLLRRPVTAGRGGGATAVLSAERER
jgi:glycosyltransferase involved in cell wall biosynthesis